MLSAARIWSRISATGLHSDLAPIRGTFKQNRKILKQFCLANYSCSRLRHHLPKSGVTNVCATASVGNRFYTAPHNDLPFPHNSFIKERRDSTNSPAKPASESADKRKLFTYVVLAAGLIPANYGAMNTVLQYVMCMATAADVLAMARMEFKLDVIPEGTNMTLKWRNKPLFIRHRTPDQIARMEAVSMDDLRDKEPDSVRVQRPEWSILIGICPHLGCSPIPNMGEHDGGYYCPCHGSHFDASGRIRKGPAPTNMEIPEYFFTSYNTVIVG